jgi:SAM-dependent methyltransferase
MNMPTEWWKNFFTGLTLDLWRAAMTEEQTRTEADFIEKTLHLSPPAKVLDVPCGNGRLSLELASRGYQLTGVDLSPGFIDEARSTSAERQLSTVWKHGDMRDLPWPEEFDGAFCWGNSFGYLDDEGNANFLKAVARVLKPEGRFVVDASSVAELILPRFEERSWMQIGDILFLEENRYDHVQSRYDTEYTFVRDGKVEKRFGSHRIYTYRELCRLLDESGFTKLEAYGSLSQEPFRLGSPNLFLATTKK